VVRLEQALVVTALGRGDFSALVAGSTHDVVQGTVTRVSGSQIFVICPNFDGGYEFGPVRYSGPIPAVGAGCVIAVMKDTTEAWLISWDGPYTTNVPLAYVELTSTVNVTGTAGAQQTLLTTPSFNCDGVSAITVEFAAPYIQSAAGGDDLQISLWDNGVDKGIMERYLFLGAMYTPITCKRRYVPTAGAHVIVVKTWHGGANTDTIVGGVGGSNTPLPAFLKVTLGEGGTGPTGPTGPTGVGPGGLTIISKGTNYSAQHGDLVMCTTGITVTLPLPTVGLLVGVEALSTVTGAAPVSITTPSGLIFGLGIGVGFAGSATMTLGRPGSRVTLKADGTNWYVTEGAQDTGWIAMPLSGDFTDFGAPYMVSQYRKVADQVMTRGLVKKTNTNALTNEVVATFPTGFRPTATLNSFVQKAALDNATNGYALLDVNNAGQLFISVGFTAAATNGNLSLNGLQFTAEQ
jgi:hypothetical protein